MDVDRNAAPVVVDRNGIVSVNDDADLVRKTGEHLVDGIVDDLVHEIMKSPLRRPTDVHPRTLANGFQPLEHRDLTRAILRGGRLVGSSCLALHSRKTP